jgi:hypothetical protein
MNRFEIPGSPLHRKPVPPDWKDLDPAGKRARCVALGWATDLYEAGKLLAKHAAATMAGRPKKRQAHHDVPKWWDR